MRVGRSTWRGWPTPTGTAWWRRATWCVRARPAPRSRGCGAPALALPNDAHHHALDHDVALVHAQRRHGGGGGFAPGPAPPPPLEALPTAPPPPPPPHPRSPLSCPLSPS